MEASQISPSQIAISPTHPLLLVAAASVSVFSLAGVGVLAGWLPGPGISKTTPTQLTAAPAGAPDSPRQKIAAPQKQARPIAQSTAHAPASADRNSPAPMTAHPAIAGPRQEASLGVSPTPTSASTFPEPVYRVAAPTPPICTECGVVETVREVAVEPKGSGGGAVAGGLVGGLIANQIGKGSTRSIATLLGVAGGAYAGNYIEKSIKESKRYDVVVRFEDDSTRTFSSESLPAWQSGDRVRLQNGLLTMGGGRSNGNPGTI